MDTCGLGQGPDDTASCALGSEDARVDEGGKSTCDLTTTSPCQEVGVVRADWRTLEGD